MEIPQQRLSSKVKTEPLLFFFKGETGKWPNNGQGERVLSLNAHGTGQMICKDCCCWDRAVEEPHNEEKDSRRQGKE